MLAAWFERNSQDILSWFHDLHRHPEVGFEEVRTAAFVADRLRAFGLAPETGIGGTGVVATLVGKRGPGRAIGLRAELDALPMTEESGLDYASRVEGKFHGCGHDGHAVTLLAAAGYLAAHDDFEGTVRFIFQPAEELLTGAKAMIADGLFTRFPCDEVYALHTMPGLPAGQVGLPFGAATASADAIDVMIRADGTHGSAPHTGADGVLAAASFITSAEQLATRVVDARQAGVISFGSIHGGAVRNILPAEVRIEATMRTNAVEVRDRLARLIDDVARATELAHGVTVEAEVRRMAPVAVNDNAAAEAVALAVETALGPDRILRGVAPIMASEDFAFMLETVPGAFFFVGQDGPYPHNPAFAFDPEIIPTGATVFSELVRARGKPVYSGSERAGEPGQISTGR